MEETKPAPSRKRKTAAKSPAVPVRSPVAAAGASSKKAAVPRKSPAARTGSVAPDGELYARIRVAAYLRAERRGFAPGNEIDDWLAAEAEVRERLGPLPAAPKKKASPRKPRGG